MINDTKKYERYDNKQTNILKNDTNKYTNEITRDKQRLTTDQRVLPESPHMGGTCPQWKVQPGRKNKWKEVKFLLKQKVIVYVGERLQSIETERKTTHRGSSHHPSDQNANLWV